MGFDSNAYISFLIQAEGLKNVLRHSYTSSGRHESVAEHCWMLTLIAITLLPQLPDDVDAHKILMMTVIHDLPEVITGDIPTFYKDGQHGYYEAELEAMQQILTPLPESLQHDLFAVWHEYEAQESIEARIAYAIDKFEALLQHALADISTWDEQDLKYQTAFDHPKHLAVKVNPIFEDLKRVVDQMTMEKVNQA
jgi:putative hydrolase of HD superfamily